jgi:hypothetical protein
MAETQQELKTDDAGSKTSSTTRKRRRATAGARRVPKSGGERLRSAVDKLVGCQCGSIAKALVDKTIAGNMTGARLLIELSGAKNPAQQPPKKPHGLTQAQQLALEPQWQGSLEDDDATSDPAFYTKAPINLP